MTNLNTKSAVWKLIEKDPSILLDLERDLINVRALARYCSQQGVEGTEDAIISAIRRYPMEGTEKKQYTLAVDIFSKSILSTKSNIVNISLVRSSEIQEILPQLFSHISFERGDTLRIIQGQEAIKILIDERNLEKIQELIPARLILEIQKDLAEINMHLHPRAVKTPGILFLIGGELFRNKVNIFEMLSCLPELLIFVDEKDLLKAYRVLFELCHAKK